MCFFLPFFSPFCSTVPAAGSRQPADGVMDNELSNSPDVEHCRVGLFEPKTAEGHKLQNAAIVHRNENRHGPTQMPM